MADKLPPRSTRGRRMRQAVDDEEQAADTDFWNQEFFAEEVEDNDYEMSSVSEDVPDSDFDDDEVRPCLE
jgi:vacuolar protein sorting-associated protein 72